MNRNLIFILANAAVISILVFGAVAVGFFAYGLLGVRDQTLVQVPIALISGVAAVVAWLVGTRRVNRLVVDRDYIVVFLAVFPVSAVIWVPVHYVVTGYLTSFGNVGALWGIQFAVNSIALVIAASLVRRASGNHPSAAPR